MRDRQTRSKLFPSLAIFLWCLLHRNSNISIYFYCVIFGIARGLKESEERYNIYYVRVSGIMISRRGSMWWVLSLSFIQKAKYEEEMPPCNRSFPLWNNFLATPEESYFKWRSALLSLSVIINKTHAFENIEFCLREQLLLGNKKHDLPSPTEEINIR